MKTIRCRHPKEGLTVVKLFAKPELGMDVSGAVRIVKEYHQALMKFPGVLSYPLTVETDRAVYLARQFLYSSLYDRISTRPFLETTEKIWITYQLMSSLRDTHALNLCHGDIKCENVLISSWNWAYLCDFAPYKPTWLPEDNPANFSYFFDTSARRTCYVAPERFVTGSTGDLSDYVRRGGGGNDPQSPSFILANGRSSLRPAMDIFGLGCVIAELFLEGKSIFTLAQLLQYKGGEYDPGPELAKIRHEPVRALIQRMIHLDPKQRPSAAQCLRDGAEVIFPAVYGEFLYPYMAGFATFLASLQPTDRTDDSVHLSSPPGAGAGPSELPNSARHLATLYFTHSGVDGPSQTSNSPATLPTVILCCSDARIDRIYHDWDTLCTTLDLPLPSLPPSPKTSESTPTSPPPARLPHPAALILISLVTACLRNTAYPTSKRHGLELLLWLAAGASDDHILNRILPHVLSLVSDDSAAVRQAAIHILTQLLTMVRSLAPQDADLFPDYLLPSLRGLLNDPEPMVRMALASSMAALAETAVHFLEQKAVMGPNASHQISQSDTSSSPIEPGARGNSGSVSARGKKPLWLLRLQFQGLITHLLTDTHPGVRRALLVDMTRLAIFFGRTMANDFLLSHVITFLNDRDWHLRSAFFEAVVGIAAVVGPRSLELYILPLMQQSLADANEGVVEKVLHCFTALTETGLFGQLALWDLFQQVLPMLYHPNPGIRYGTVALVAAVAAQLPEIDRWCLVVPALEPFLQVDTLDITCGTLLAGLKPPITRRLFQEILAKPLPPELSTPGRAPLSSGPPDPSDAGSIGNSSTGSPSLVPRILHHRSPSQESTYSSSGDTQYSYHLSGIGDPVACRWQYLRNAEPRDYPKLDILAPYIVKLKGSAALHPRTTGGGGGSGVQAGTTGSLSDVLSLGSGPSHSHSGAGGDRPGGGYSVELRDLGLTPHTVFLTPWDAERPVLPATGPGRNITPAGVTVDHFRTIPITKSMSACVSPAFPSVGGRPIERIASEGALQGYSPTTTTTTTSCSTPSSRISSVLTAQTDIRRTISKVSALAPVVNTHPASIARTRSPVKSPIDLPAVVGIPPTMSDAPRSVSRLTSKASPSVVVSQLESAPLVPPSSVATTPLAGPVADPVPTQSNPSAMLSLTDALYSASLGSWTGSPPNSHAIPPLSLGESTKQPPPLAYRHQLLQHPRFGDTPTSKYRHILSGATGGGYFDSHLPRLATGDPQAEVVETMATAVAPTSTAEHRGAGEGSSHQDRGESLGAPRLINFPSPIEVTSPTSALHWLIHYDAGQTVKILLRKKALEIFPRPLPELGPATNPATLTHFRRLTQEAIPSLQSWRPEGTLVAFFKDHTAAINAISLSTDQALFATASDDMTVKVWDCLRLEKHVLHRARSSYDLGARVQSLTFLQGTYSLAATGDDGSIHLLRIDSHAVDTRNKYGTCQLVRRSQLSVTTTNGGAGNGGLGEYAIQIAHVQAENQSYLLVATTASRLVALDIHTLDELWSVHNPLRFGLVTAFVTDPRRTWVLVGTAKGVLTLWDLRFRIAVKSWQHPRRSRIHQLSMYLAPASHGKWVLVATGRNEVSVWDVESESCHEVFCGQQQQRSWEEIRLDVARYPYVAHLAPTIEEALRAALVVSSGTDGSNSSGSGGSTNPNAADATMAVATSSHHPGSGDTAVNAVVYPSNGKFLLTAGSDRKLRYWDLECIEESYVISGGGSGGGKGNGHGYGYGGTTTGVSGNGPYLPNDGGPCIYEAHRMGPTRFYTETPLSLEAIVPPLSPALSAASSSSVTSMVAGAPRQGSRPTARSSGFTKLIATGMALGGGGSGGGSGTSASAAIAATNKLRRRPRPRPAFADHEDCITALQLTEVPYPMIISGARNGVIRIFM
ncbi:Serine/threonine-protein kinase [Dimargaris cristalligena]|nr:Serine/threonine-protein kinase [Dimargaris cristalligena]